ncbi:MAG: TonB-dependent receptor, partial [Spongiibacteraceae bacterium]|nr:TonB-dependent receptor [Spongiibacteraceae bacterium]
MARSPIQLVRSRQPLAAAIAGSLLLFGGGQAIAQSAGALEEVVVTAQFREQNLQSTPIAITAISAADMEARGISGLTDIDNIAPNVQLRPTGAEFGNAITAFIRGVGQSDTSFAFEPAVGIYVDDVYYATLYGSQLDLLDLERAEVLRGPQGTLFGKNSVGGAVRLITRKPDGTQGGFIEATVGSLDRQTFRGAFEATLVEDKAFMRISALSEQRDGYQDIIDFACAHPDKAGSLPSELPAAGPGADCDLGTYGGRDVEAMRLALRFLPTDRLEINLTGDIYNDDSEAPAITVLALQQSGPMQDFNDRVNLPLYGIALDERFLTDDIYKTYATNSDPTLGTRLTRGAPVDSWGLNAVIDYELTPDMMLTSITNYRETEGEYSTDNDGSPLQVQNLQYLPTVEQFTQEFRLTGSALDSRLNYTTGLFYFKSEQTLKGGVQNSLYGLEFYQDDKFETENYSVFINLDYALTDRLNAVVGLRYTDEEKTYDFAHPPFLVVPDPVVS